MEAKSQSLTERSIAAVKWNYLGVVARIASQFVVQIALARLLGPEAFGLFAASILVIGLGAIVVEMGLGSALVQKHELSDLDIRFAFTWVLIAGIAMAITVYLFAGHVAVFFDDPRIVDVVRGLTPAFILQALGVVPISLLKRELAFKAIQGVQIASYLGGFLVIGVWTALLGAGVWSLVAAWIGQTAIAAAILYFVRRHPIKPIFLKGSVLFKGFGSRVLFTNIANWTIENVDNLLVGRFFGPNTLGLYSVSYSLVRNPANHLVATLQSVLFPASARAQGNQDGLRRAYLTVLAGVALIAFPLFSGVVVVSDTLVVTLFGHHWADASPILVPLALAMIFHSAMAITGPVLWGMGAAGTELKVQLVVGLTLIGALLMVSRYSVVAVAWAVCAVYSLRFIAMTVALARYIHLSFSDLARAVQGGIVAAMIVVAVLIMADVILSDTTVILRLVLEIVLAALAMCIFLLTLPRFALSDELAWIAQRLLSEVPCLGKSLLLRRLGALRTKTPAAGSP